MFSMSASDPRCQRHAELSRYAYRFGLAFGAQGERDEADVARHLRSFELFERCFFAVRMGAALELRLAQAPTTRDSEERERPDRERRDPTDHSLDMAREREREREREPASVPLLLKTLGRVADDAAALPGPVIADLPGLRELLTTLGSDPAPARRPAPAKPSARPGLRARLATSAAAPVLTIPPPARPSPLLALRKATGPPRR